MTKIDTQLVAEWLEKFIEENYFVDCCRTEYERDMKRRPNFYYEEAEHLIKAIEIDG